MRLRDFSKNMVCLVGSMVFATCGVTRADVLLENQAPAFQAAAKPTNVVFFLVDDLGWRDIGAFGSPFYDTPNVDRLASQGMRFTQAYAACPVCSPTRASIMSGKYPARLNTTDFFGGPQPDRVLSNKKWKRSLVPAAYVPHLPLEEVSLAEAFKQQGYATFFAGKWHLGGPGYFPEDQGFDVNRGGLERGGPYGGKRYFSPYGNAKLTDGPEGEHLPDRLATETCKFIEANENRPFLAYLSFYSVHTPLMAREDLKAKYKARAEALEHAGPVWGQEGARKVRLVQDHAVYGGMVEAMDLAVGKVLDKVTALGLEENTVVVFMSDNGGLSTSEGHPTSNLPLRAGKGWLYEGGIREPMIIKWPGVTQAGSVCSETVVSTDFCPTLLDMAGLPALPDQHVDGVSLVPLLKGATRLDRTAVYWHYPHYGNQGGSPGAAVRVGDYKLIEFFEDGRLELYNLRQDIGEQEDLAARMPGKVKALSDMLHQWFTQVEARMPTPYPGQQEK